MTFSKKIFFAEFIFKEEISRYECEDNDDWDRLSKILWNKMEQNAVKFKYLTIKLKLNIYHTN